jgi:hypothetical protein
MKVNFANKTVGGFSYEFIRGISTQQVGAAEFGEGMETMTRVHNGNFESWIQEWKATADRVAAYAENALRSGDQTVARGAYLKASNYYRMAVFYAHHTEPRHTTLWQRSKECFQRMLQLMDQLIEALDIDFEGAKLPAYFSSLGVREDDRRSSLWEASIRRWKSCMAGSALSQPITAGIVSSSRVPGNRQHSRPIQASFSDQTTRSPSPLSLTTSSLVPMSIRTKWP